jgi:hypothetical protein
MRPSFREARAQRVCGPSEAEGSSNLKRQRLISLQAKSTPRIETLVPKPMVWLIALTSFGLGGISMVIFLRLLGAVQ